ncbi:MAG: DUF3500 domain-containing protein [Proteobacteria bacterium]|nr:DUF3500 domain-containing protein [Pseudomonadota bacterium]
MHVRSPIAAAHTAVEMESETAVRMAEAATTFLGSLKKDQQTRVLFSLEDEERLNWHYIPRERQGLTFKEMDGSQRKLAHALLSSGLSRRGYAKALDIMSLESILGELEGPARRYPRDPDLYHVTLFGTPSDESPWGWRVEGHHLSANFLVVGGNRIAPTPNFFGANPARVPKGPLTGLRVLAAEEDLARQLLASLGTSKQARAIIDSEAPADIITTAEPRVKIDDPSGLAAAEMTEDQRRLLMDLLIEYTSRMPRDVADTRMNQIEKEGKAHIHFAWAGSKKQGQGHYYRVHGPSFLIEYDNTQNNANHIHTVWRDLRDDWGEDLLRGHYAKSH